MQPPVKLEESDVRESLLQSSKESRDFYDNERHRAGRIEWFFNPHLAEEIVAADAAHFYHINEKYHEIHLPRFPNLDDARLVAHEIVHAILAEENHSLIIYQQDDRYGTLGTHLGTLLEDPIVDSFLQEIYHLDLSKDSVRRLPIIKRAWKDQAEPIDRFSRIATAFLLANQMMKWRLIIDHDALQNWCDYLVWFSDGRPNIFLTGVEFVAIMQKNGLETLDQRRTAFFEIVKRYQLEDFLSLENNFAPKV